MNLGGMVGNKEGIGTSQRDTSGTETAQRGRGNRQAHQKPSFWRRFKDGLGKGRSQPPADAYTQSYLKNLPEDIKQQIDDEVKKGHKVKVVALRGQGTEAGSSGTQPAGSSVVGAANPGPQRTRIDNTQDINEFYKTGELGYRHYFIPGFYACYGDFPELGEKRNVPPYETLKGLPVLQGREVVLVDPGLDVKFKQVLDQARATTERWPRTAEKVQNIVSMVVHHLGGPNNDTDLQYRHLQFTHTHQQQQQSCVVYLGNLKFGASFHRALMAKCVLSVLGVKSRIARELSPAESTIGQQRKRLFFLDEDKNEFQVNLTDSPGYIIRGALPQVRAPSPAPDRMQNAPPQIPGNPGLPSQAHGISHAHRPPSGHSAPPLSPRTQQGPAWPAFTTGPLPLSDTFERSDVPSRMQSPVPVSRSGSAVSLALPSGSTSRLGHLGVEGLHPLPSNAGHDAKHPALSSLFPRATPDSPRSGRSASTEAFSKLGSQTIPKTVGTKPFSDSYPNPFSRAPAERRPSPDPSAMLATMSVSTVASLPGTSRVPSAQHLSTNISQLQVGPYPSDSASAAAELNANEFWPYMKGQANLLFPALAPKISGGSQAPIPPLTRNNVTHGHGREPEQPGAAHSEGDGPKTDSVFANIQSSGLGTNVSCSAGDSLVISGVLSQSAPKLGGLAAQPASSMALGRSPGTDISSHVSTENPSVRAAFNEQLPDVTGSNSHHPSSFGELSPMGSHGQGGLVTDPDLAPAHNDTTLLFNNSEFNPINERGAHLSSIWASAFDGESHARDAPLPQPPPGTPSDPMQINSLARRVPVLPASTHSNSFSPSTGSPIPYDHEVMQAWPMYSNGVKSSYPDIQAADYTAVPPPQAPEDRQYGARLKRYDNYTAEPPLRMPGFNPARGMLGGRPMSAPSSRSSAAANLNRGRSADTPASGFKKNGQPAAQTDDFSLASKALNPSYHNTTELQAVAPIPEHTETSETSAQDEHFDKPEPTLMPETTLIPDSPFSDDQGPMLYPDSVATPYKLANGICGATQQPPRSVGSVPDDTPVSNARRSEGETVHQQVHISGVDGEDHQRERSLDTQTSAMVENFARNLSQCPVGDEGWVADESISTVDAERMPYESPHDSYVSAASHETQSASHRKDAMLAPAPFAGSLMTPFGELGGESDDEEEEEGSYSKMPATMFPFADAFGGGAFGGSAFGGGAFAGEHSMNVDDAQCSVAIASEEGSLEEPADVAMINRGGLSSVMSLDQNSSQLPAVAHNLHMVMHGDQSHQLERQFRMWINYTDITLSDSVIGRGSYGQVMLGNFRTGKCAVKQIICEKKAEYRAAMQEMLLMQELTFDKIVRFFGAIKRSKRVLWMCMEYMPYSDLRKILHSEEHRRSVRFPEHLLSLICRLKWAKDVVSSLDFLHSRAVVHRDLKPGNVLISMKGDAVLSDFGLSRVREAQQSRLQASGPGTVSYAAPEALGHHHFSTASDMYSFGCVLWELLSMKEPWSELHGAPFRIMSAICNDKTSLKVEDIPLDVRNQVPEVIDTVRQCLSFDPSQRPTAVQVHEVLEEAIER